MQMAETWGKNCRDSREGKKKVVEKNPVNYNCRELLKHDSGAGGEEKGEI